MLPLVVPEPAGGPPAIPPTVPTPNEHAGVGADRNAFAALVDAGTDGPGVGSGSAKGAGKHVRGGAGNWLLAKLSVLSATADGGAASSIVVSQHDARTVEDANVGDKAGESDDDESTDVPFATTTSDMTLLCDRLSAAPTAAIRIPVPGDEDAEDDGLVTSNDAPLSTRVPGLGRSEAFASPAQNAPVVSTNHEQVTTFTGTGPTDQRDPTAARAETSDATTSAEESVVGRVNNVAMNTPQQLQRVDGRIVSTIPAITTASERSHAEQALIAAKQPAPALDETSDAQTNASAERAASPGDSPRPWASDVRPFRPAVSAHVPQGTTVRSAVATAATSSDKPADAVRTIVEAATAAPAQEAPGVTRDASEIRSTPSDVGSRRFDVATSGLPFSMNRDTSESGAGDDEARGRQASAMSARLAAAVASTSEPPASARTAGPSHVFAIPGVITTTSHAVTAAVEAHAATPALPAENIDRLVQAMHVNVRSGVMEATVTLRPEHFGEVTIQLRVDGTNVTALIQAESSGVRQWLESQEQAIRNGLAAHGLELDRLVVNPDGEQQQSRDDSEANESRRRAHRRRQQSTERFEITV